MENKVIRRMEAGERTHINDISGRKEMMSLAQFLIMFGSEADGHFSLHHIYQPYHDVLQAPKVSPGATSYRRQCCHIEMWTKTKTFKKGPPRFLNVGSGVERVNTWLALEFDSAHTMLCRWASHFWLDHHMWVLWELCCFSWTLLHFLTSLLIVFIGHVSHECTQLLFFPDPSFSSSHVM